MDIDSVNDRLDSIRKIKQKKQKTGAINELSQDIIRRWQLGSGDNSVDIVRAVRDFVFEFDEKNHLLADLNTALHTTPDN